MRLKSKAFFRHSNIDSETVKPVFDGKPRGFFAVFKIEGFFGSVRFKLDNSIVKTG